MRVFNIHKAPEQKTDIKLSTIMRSVPVPSEIDLTEHCGPIRDQEDSGLCWAFATASLKDMQEHMETGRQYEMSPLHIAKHTKLIDGLPDEEGSAGDFAMRTLKNIGAIEERHYPFGKYEQGSLDFPELDETGLQHYKTKVFAKIETVADMQQALALGRPFTFDFVALDSIHRLLQGEDIMPMPTKGILKGGHRELAVGHSLSKTAVDVIDGKTRQGYLKVQNSWGTGCGDKGIHWIPYDYFSYTVTVMGDQKMTFWMGGHVAIDLENDPVNENVITMVIGKNNVIVNGKPQVWDVAPVIDAKSSRTLVPLRNVAEVLGYTVGWNDSTRTITLTHKNGEMIVMVVGDSCVMVNGELQYWDVAPIIDAASSRTLVPLRNIAEALGYYLVWDDREKKITLVKEG